MNSTHKNPGTVGKHQRFCPALNGPISSADCGAQRGSKLQCPAECPFFPFAPAGYDLWLKLDENWGRKAFNFVAEQVGRERFTKVLGARRPLEGVAQMGDTVLVFSDVLNRSLFVERDAAGRTLAERWEEAGFAGLNNDERVMTQWRRHSFVTVVEVQKKLDHQSMLCLDVLHPEAAPFVLFDRAGTPQIVRFTRLFAWVTRYPHFTRLGGMAVEISKDIWPLWREVIESRLAQERVSQPGLTLEDWLNRHYLSAADMGTDLAQGYRTRMLTGADFYQCIATYRMTKSQAVFAILKSRPDFAPEEPTAKAGRAKPLAQFLWLRRGESALYNQTQMGAPRHQTSDGSVGTLGHVSLYPDQMVVETMSKKKYAFARQMAERFFGSNVTFENEVIVDLMKLDENRPREIELSPEVEAILDKAFAEGRGNVMQLDVTQEAVPLTSSGAGRSKGGAAPRPDKAASVAPMLLRHYRTLLDERSPALENHTPRAAAQSSALRPLLVEWMKDHIHQIESNNLRDGSHHSLDWVVEELGLTELKS